MVTGEWIYVQHELQYTVRNDFRGGSEILTIYVYCSVITRVNVLLKYYLLLQWRDKAISILYI